MNKSDSSILDNKERGKVGEYLGLNIEKGASLSIVSAYFTIYAYKELKKQLDNIKELNFLFGEPSFLKGMTPQAYCSREFQLEDSSCSISLRNRLKQKKDAFECAKWIEDKVNIKSMIKPNFLHGKMYYIQNPGKDPKAVIGSSNFTYSGLGFDHSDNIELNMFLNDKRDMNDLKDWFDEAWNNSNGLVEDVKKEVLEYLKKTYKENSPESVYLFTLYKIFKNYLEHERNLIFEDRKFQNTKIWSLLYDFQKDGVKAAINKVERYGGCIIADSVGLGKTFEALAVIKYYEMKNDRVLVLCPKRLHQNWNDFLGNVTNNILYEDKFGYDVFYHTDLTRTSGKAANGFDISKVNWDRYDLVVIDESHNFRNNKTVRNRQTRYQKLMEIIKSGKRTKVVLLSATPINTKLNDLKNQIHLITKEKEDALSEQGIKSISGVIKKAQYSFTNWVEKSQNGNKKPLIEDLDSDFFKLLDEYTISRSRTHILKYYDTNKIGKFPQRFKPISIYSKIDTENQLMSYKELNEKILEIKLSIYYPSNYIYKKSEEEFSERYDIKIGEGRTVLTQKDREKSLIKMLKSNYLKRLESSINSFTLTAMRLKEKMEKVIEKIENYISKKEEYKNMFIELEEPQTDEIGDDDELIDIIIEGKIKYNLIEMKASEWLKDIKADLKNLDDILKQASTIDCKRDAKLEQLKKCIEEKIEKPINPKNKKALIFTAFSDTAKYLYDNLELWVKNKNLNIALVTGSGETKTTFGKSSYEEILSNFSPLSKYRKEATDKEIDILIATDCISEGQNLQDCDYLINYDIHWNPVRIIQRFGRIDRIGSKNEKIQMVNFWPEKDLDFYINLEKRVKSRMALVDIAGSGKENVFKTTEDEDQEGKDFRTQQLKKLKDEVIDLEDMDGTITLADFTLNDFRSDLNNFLNANKAVLEKTPEGIYSIISSPAGDYPGLRKEFSNEEKINMDKNNLAEIKPGTIFCLRLKEERSHEILGKLEKFNPIAPYFLCYVYDNGEIKYSYTNLKQLLDIYKLLCSKEKEPIKELTDILSIETSEYENMDKYSQLLKKAVEQIKWNIEKQSLKTLSANTPRGEINLIDSNQKIEKEENFELISFLIIK